MNNLLDTHTFIWFVEGDAQLSENARKTIEEKGVENFVSIANLWEIAIKISLEKLELKTPFSRILEEIVKNGFKLLPITFEDTLTLSSLPFHHRDPFDRIIISQCISRNVAALSKDKAFEKYEITVIW